MDIEVIKLGESLGFGGILAGGMFWFYRRDSIDARERLEALTRDYHSMLERLFRHLEDAEPPKGKTP